MFREVLYVPGAIGERTRTGQRSASIALILAVLEMAKGGLTAGQLRKRIVSTKLPASHPLSKSEPVAQAQALWTVLQVRQAHRLAFEALFGWIEERVLLYADATSQMLAANLMELLSELDVSKPRWVQDMLSGYTRSAEAFGSTMQAGMDSTDGDVFGQIEALQDCLPGNRNESAVRAIRILLLVTALTEELDSDKRCQPLLLEGGRPRVSLKYWAEFVRQKQELPVAQFLVSTIENFLLSQHFGIAALRTSQNKPRLRMTIEEQGLSSLLKAADAIWVPAPTPDRLESALSLMAECRLIQSKKDEAEGVLVYSTH